MGPDDSTAKSELERKHATSLVELGRRISQLLDRFESRKKAAFIAKVSTDQLAAYVAGRNKPSFPVMTRLALAADVNLAWLATGEGEMHPFQVGPMFEAAERAGHIRPLDGGAVGAGLPVLSLAKCGLKGWYKEGTLAVRAARPGDLHDPDAFAVMAVGDSLRPAGIWPGFLCMCSPRSRYDRGDAVFVGRKDRTASLKLLESEDPEWIALAGYLPPDDDGKQVLYTERLRRDQVHRIATVVYVKRKL